MKLSEEQQLDHILRRMASDDSIDAPTDAIKYVKDLFRTRISEPVPTLLRQVLAVLQADLAPGTAVFGERSAGEAKARQMLFDSGDNAVDLRIKSSEKGFAIHGQILGDGFENGTATIEGGDSVIKVDIDTFSEFGFSGIVPGQYSLLLHGATHEIAIEALDLD